MKSKAWNTEEVDETVSHSRSSFETVAAILGQARKMKQNPFWYCFRARTFNIEEVTVSHFGPEILGRL